MQLSYSSARRSLIMMAVYLVCASLIIKGVGHLLEFNFLNAIQSMLQGNGVNFTMPDFNFDNLSFDLIGNTLKEKVRGIFEVLIPSAALGVINYTHIGSSIAANKAVVTGASKLALRV